MNFALGSTYGNVGSVSVIGKWSNLLWSLKSLMVSHISQISYGHYDDYAMAVRD